MFVAEFVLIYVQVSELNLCAYAISIKTITNGHYDWCGLADLAHNCSQPMAIGSNFQAADSASNMKANPAAQSICTA